MFLELLAAAAFLAGGDSDRDHHSSFGPRSRKGFGFDDDEFEEDGSFYDRHGNEHIVDEDMYCEDCDDYHDDYDDDDY